MGIPARARRRAEFVTWRRGVEWASVLGGFVLARFVQRPSSFGEWLLLVVAGLLVAVPMVLSAHREHRRDEEAQRATALAIEQQARVGLILGDAVTPIADLLSRINLASGDERAALQAQLGQRVVDAAAELCGRHRARAVFFARKGRELRLEAWAGRARHPRESFRRDETGRIAYDLVDQRKYLLVPDVRRPPRGVSVSKDADYRSFLAVAVHAGDRAFGLLTLDVPDPRGLDQNDLAIALALAQCLAAGLAASVELTLRNETEQTHGHG